MDAAEVRLSMKDKETYALAERMKRIDARIKTAAVQHEKTEVWIQDLNAQDVIRLTSKGFVLRRDFRCRIFGGAIVSWKE